jgi:ferredoxin
MPRIEFDQSRRVGHAQCYAAAPDVYELDDNGYLLPPPNVIDESLRDTAIAGASGCPEGVLKVFDDE